jgi:hypothetical protein
MTGRGRAFAVGLLVLSVGGCTHAPWNPYRGWRAWRSGDVVLYTDTLFEQRQALGWIVDTSRILERTFFRHLNPRPLRVLYIQPGNTSPFVQADGAKKDGVVVARLPGSGGGRGLVTVGRWDWPWSYAHLVAHHFIEATVPGAPLWFHEGFAHYLSVFSVREETPGVVCFGFLDPGASWQVTVSLPELLAASWADYNRASAPWLAPSAWGLIDFLFHGDGGRWRSRQRPLMDALAAGRTSEEALLEAFSGLTLKELDLRVREHVRTRKPRGTCPLPVRLQPGAPEDTEVSKSAVDEAEIRGFFQGLEALPDRKGYADFFPASAGTAAASGPR